MKMLFLCAKACTEKREGGSGDRGNGNISAGIDGSCDCGKLQLP